jgi:hypothetical protein
MIKEFLSRTKISPCVTSRDGRVTCVTDRFRWLNRSIGWLAMQGLIGLGAGMNTTAAARG